MTETPNALPAQTNESAQIPINQDHPRTSSAVSRPSFPLSKSLLDDDFEEFHSRSSTRSPKGKQSPQKNMSPYTRSPLLLRNVSNEEPQSTEATTKTHTTNSPPKGIRRSSSAKNLTQMSTNFGSFRSFGEDIQDQKGLIPSKYKIKKNENLFPEDKTKAVDDDESSENLKTSKTSFQILDNNPDIAFQEEPDYKLEFEFPYNKHTETNQMEGGHVMINVDHSYLLVNDPFIEENSQAAKNIIKLLSLRDKYLQIHSDCNAKIISITKDSQINYLITYRGDSPEPIINYSIEKNILPHDKEMSYQTKDGVFVPMVKGKAIATPIPMKEYIEDLSLIMKENLKPLI